MFPSPAAQSFLINGRMHRVFTRQGTLVPATPGWAEICGPAVVRGFGVRLPCLALFQQWGIFSHAAPNWPADAVVATPGMSEHVA